MTYYDDLAINDELANEDERVPLQVEDCLEFRLGATDNVCFGAVEYRWPLSSTGKPFPRCDKHWDKRLKVQEGINRRYPVHAPSDFDPYYAGESWDEDF